MRKQVCLALLASLTVMGSSAAQSSPLDKLQAAQIPAAERDGLPPEVVAVLGSSRGWHKTQGPILSLQATANGKLISNAGSGIHVWDLDKLQVLKVAKGDPKDNSRVVAVSPDGQKMLVFQTFFSLAKDKDPAQVKLELWEILDGMPKQVATLIDGGIEWHHGDSIAAVFQDKDNKLVVLWPGRGIGVTVVRTWNLAVKPVLELPPLPIIGLPLPKDAEMQGACLIDQGRSVALLVGESSLKQNLNEPKGVKPQVVVVDIATKKQVKTVDMPVEPPLGRSLMSDDGRWLVVMGYERKFYLYDLAASPAKLAYTGLSAEYYRPTLAFDPSGKWFAYVGTEDKAAPADPPGALDHDCLLLLELAAGAPKVQTVLTQLRMPDVEVVAFTPGSLTLLSARNSGLIQAWDLQTGKAMPRPPNAGHQSWVWATSFTPDGKSLLTAGRDRQFCLWDLGAAKPTLIHAAKDRSLVFSLTPAPDGVHWATGGMNPGGVSLWKLQAGKLSLSQELPAQPQDVWTTAFSKDGQWLYMATGKETGTNFAGAEKPIEEAGGGIGVWQLQGDKAVLKTMLREHKGAVMSIALSPDGKHLVSAGGRLIYSEKPDPTGFGEIFVWDLSGEQPKKIAQLEGHEQIVYRVMFSPDGKTLVTAGRNKGVGLWSINGDQFKLRKVLEGSKDPVYAMDFHPDGKTLVTGDFSGQVLLWDVKTTAALHKWQFHDRICSLAFAPDGRHFATGNAWGTAYIFRLPQEKK